MKLKDVVTEAKLSYLVLEWAPYGRLDSWTTKLNTSSKIEIIRQVTEASQPRSTCYSWRSLNWQYSYNVTGPNDDQIV